MAIRVEFYAENQVDASSIVEFALSVGAILQSYNEVDAPLAKPAKKAKAKKRAGAVFVKASQYVMCVISDNPFREGGARWKCAEIIAGHNEPILAATLYEELERINCTESNAKKALSILVEKGHVKITHGAAPAQ